jgi:hypothetical protein
VQAMIVIRGDGNISMDHRLNPGYSYYTIRSVDQALRGIPGVTVIRTTFDRDHPDNRKFSAETDRQENIFWTEQERARAEAGEVIQDLDDLRDKVSVLEFVFQLRRSCAY